MWFVPGEASDGHQWRRGVRNSDTRYRRRGVMADGESVRADQTGLFWKVLHCSAPIKRDKGRSAQLIGAEKCRAF